MAYAPSAVAPRELNSPESSTSKRTIRRGLLLRLFDSMMTSRQRQADREIARFLAARGYKYNDETEREIERRFLSTSSYW